MQWSKLVREGPGMMVWRRSMLEDRLERGSCSWTVDMGKMECRWDTDCRRVRLVQGSLGRRWVCIETMHHLLDWDTSYLLILDPAPRAQRHEEDLINNTVSVTKI